MSETYRVIPNQGKGFILQGVSDGRYYGGSFSCDSKEFMQAAQDHMINGELGGFTAGFRQLLNLIKGDLIAFKPEEKPRMTISEQVTAYLRKVDAAIFKRRPDLDPKNYRNIAKDRYEPDVFRIARKRLGAQRERHVEHDRRLGRGRHYAVDQDKKKIMFPT